MPLKLALCKRSLAPRVRGSAKTSALATHPSSSVLTQLSVFPSLSLSHVPETLLQTFEAAPPRPKALCLRLFQKSAGLSKVTSVGPWHWSSPRCQRGRLPGPSLLSPSGLTALNIHCVLTRPTCASQLGSRVYPTAFTLRYLVVVLDLTRSELNSSRPSPKLLLPASSSQQMATLPSKCSGQNPWGHCGQSSPSRCHCSRGLLQQPLQ